MNSRVRNPFAGPFGAVKLMSSVYRSILPEVHQQLDLWRQAAEKIPDPELRRQALASLASKRFHCEGGSVYAAVNPKQRHVLIPLIVAFQTISDYLDNLCDRSTSLDANDFRMLHQAMLDAIDPSAPLSDYYACREEKDDGSYLDRLVRTCQTCICMLPSYASVEPQVRRLVRWYADLQVYKHIRLDLREDALKNWWREHGKPYPELRWNEFAAATGSTLGMFMLFLTAAESHVSPQRVEEIVQAYFPGICGLHILLDYLIDQQEDVEGKDLNFCSYYANADEKVERLSYIRILALQRARPLADRSFHRLIIEGLLALYLSDPKIRQQQEVRKIARAIMRDSPAARLFFWLNSLFIRQLQRRETAATEQH